jgi:hypothetical protein
LGLTEALYKLEKPDWAKMEGYHLSENPYLALAMNIKSEGHLKKGQQDPHSNNKLNQRL